MLNIFTNKREESSYGVPGMEKRLRLYKKKIIPLPEKTRQERCIKMKSFKV